MPYEDMQGHGIMGSYGDAFASPYDIGSMNSSWGYAAPRDLYGNTRESEMNGQHDYKYDSNNRSMNEDVRS